MTSLVKLASQAQKRHLRNTCVHFGVKPSRVLAEALLRLDRKYSQGDICLIPTDKLGKMLFDMYMHYYKRTCS